MQSPPLPAAGPWSVNTRALVYGTPQPRAVPAEGPEACAGAVWPGRPVAHQHTHSLWSSENHIPSQLPHFLGVKALSLGFPNCPKGGDRLSWNSKASVLASVPGARLVLGQRLPLRSSCVLF